jgi:hypothetical protein
MVLIAKSTGSIPQFGKCKTRAENHCGVSSCHSILNGATALSKSATYSPRWKFASAENSFLEL